MSGHDLTERGDHNREGEGGNNSPRCKVQDLRFLPASSAVPSTPHTGSSPVKHAFVLTWESYGNMFSSFFLAKALAWDVELCWWGLLKYPQ